ncbi:unnamed protein product [Chilo suppressalis]|uniref:FLYWCH-type domain-containing protein n=1 Tax=Chilo suppressalis TaxID=168631 RepID=A0ABN8AWX6_CHISP|nr:unnamed protein product [Chilo suppressalis]
MKPVSNNNKIYIAKDTVIRFSVTKRGIPILHVGGYKYNEKHRSRFGTTYWSCNRARTEMQFFKSPKGLPILELSGYRYNVKQRNLGGTMYWACNRAYKELIAFPSRYKSDLVTAILRARFARETTNIFIGGHKYFRHSRSLIGDRIRWTCSKKHKHKLCRIIKQYNGTKLLLYKEYSYNRKRTTKHGYFKWYCSKYHKGCKVTLVTNSDLVAIGTSGDHDHEPLAYYRAPSGNYVRVKDNQQMVFYPSTTHI